MNTKQLTSMFMVAILVAGTVYSFGFQSQMAAAQADDVTISTSADRHGGTFFGEGVLQVVITDDDTDDEADDTIDVDIEVENEAGASATESFNIPNTSAGSQRFEFFITHEASNWFDGEGTDAGDDDDIDPINGDGFSLTEANTSGAPIVTFGDSLEALINDRNVDPAGDDKIYEDYTITINYRNEEITIDYDSVSGEIILAPNGVAANEREIYGADSLVYVSIMDQDANINPTQADEFTLTEAELETLFDLGGADITAGLTFTESGDNTAVFEGVFTLGPGGDLVQSSESVEITMNDQSVYNTTLDDNGNEALGTLIGIEDDSINDSNDTDAVSFSIENDDGELEGISDITFGSELNVMLNDQDQNVDGDDADTLDGVLRVIVDVGDADGEEDFDAGEADEELADMEETDDNTGIFTIDAANGELKIEILADGVDPTPFNGKLELRQEDMDEDIVIQYEDRLSDGEDPVGLVAVDLIDFDTVVSLTRGLTLTTGTVELPETVGINDDFDLTINDPDLNDNPRTRDAYTFTLDGAGPEFALMRGGLPIGEAASVEVEIEGDAPVFADAITYTLRETGSNTGIFVAELDMEEILESTGADVDDGDTLEVTYNDDQDTPGRSNSDRLAIGRAASNLDFSRTVLPIPPGTDLTEDTSEFLDDATTVSTTLMVVDSEQNVATNTEDDLPLVLGTDEGEFTIEIRGADGSDIDDMLIDDAAETDDEFAPGVSLETILPDIVGGITLTETANASGVFEETLDFDEGGLDAEDWHNLEIIFTYTDLNGEEESQGITFRGNDGFVTIDKNVVSSGDVVTVTVQDEDLNIDDGEIEEFDSETAGAAMFLVIVETEDDEITDPLPTIETFTETGPDTGIFTATWTVGTDIQVVSDDSQDQASNILVTYNDEVDSTGGRGEELEVNVPVTSASGAIQVEPDLVGPGTEITVRIIDSDLNLDALSTDDYDEDDELVEFRTDRREAGEAFPDLDETGPNTGVFEFTIQLVPEEGGDDGDFGDATGGNDPEIKVLPGDLLSIRYEDEHDASGRSTTVSRVIEIRSWDPEFIADKDSYMSKDRVRITINDPDANTDADIADTLTDIRVFSDSDAVGEEFSAIETGRDTGVFTLTFSVTDETQSGAVTVTQGDNVTVEYNDAYPADYAQRIEDVNDPDKEFQFNITIGGPTGTTTTTPSAPKLQDIRGQDLTEITAGSQAIITTTVTNNNATAQPFVALVEVRDSDRITVYLQWQTGTLNPNGSANIGLSWTPDAPGTYELRTFVISNLLSPSALSPVVTSSVTVS